ncbi:MAG TPA: cytochrome c [Candidatus Limnocylindria bacterium]|nr:cytochrome c [Candidatus Limnocylindria bacterium]
MQLPITRQALQDIAQLLVIGIAIFGVLAFVTRSRGGSPRRYLQSVGVLAGITVVTYALAFTVAPDIPTPPVPFTARFQSDPVPDTDENIAAGRTLFQANCAICHGPRALGDGPASFTLQPRPFNLQVHVPLHPTGEVFYWISNGVAGTGMPAWKDKLTEEQRWQIIRYLDALASKRVAQ